MEAGCTSSSVEDACKDIAHHQQKLSRSSVEVACASSSAEDACTPHTQPISRGCLHRHRTPSAEEACTPIHDGDTPSPIRTPEGVRAARASLSAQEACTWVCDLGIQGMSLQSCRKRMFRVLWRGACPCLTPLQVRSPHHFCTRPRECAHHLARSTFHNIHIPRPSSADGV